MKTFSLVNAPHLPVTGESHPLVRESTRWLTTGNAIALLSAMLVFGGLYVWSQNHDDVTPSVIVISNPIPWNAPGGVIQTPVDGSHHSAVPFEKFRDVEKVPDAVPTEEDPGDPGALPGMIPGEPVGGPSDFTGSLPPFEAVRPDSFAYAFDEIPQLLSIDAPAYPELPRQAGIEGTVLVKVFVTRAGKVKQAVAMEGPDVFFDAAIAAAKTALFAPAKQGDKPVDVWVMIPVTFTLHR